MMNTTIANRIYIQDPTDEVKAWVKVTLAFPNPEYEKKERRGFWTGNTPKTLRLYEWNGNTLIIPFGVCRKLMPFLKGTYVTTDFRQDTVITYGDPLPLYDYQQEAVTKMLSHQHQLSQRAGNQPCNKADGRAVYRINPPGKNMFGKLLRTAAKQEDQTRSGP